MGAPKSGGRKPLEEWQVALIKYLRTECGWTQQRIAAQVGCTQNTVSVQLRKAGLRTYKTWRSRLDIRR